MGQPTPAVHSYVLPVSVCTIAPLLSLVSSLYHLSYHTYEVFTEHVQYYLHTCDIYNINISISTSTSMLSLANPGSNTLTLPKLYTQRLPNYLVYT